MAIVDPQWPRADVWLAQDAAEPEVIVAGVPSSKASLSPSRADLAPLALRERLSRFSTFDGEVGIDFAAVAVRDEGNWPVSELDMHAMPSVVEERARALPGTPLRLYLGGDNAVTRPLVRSLGDLAHVGLLTFDAHHDVRTLELGPANGTPVRGLVEEDGLPGENIVQIGIHSYANSAAYRSYCEERGIGVVTVAEVERKGMEPVVDEALARLSQRCDRLYVDVDLDVLDRVFAPGCPGSRPGGLTVRQLVTGVRRCAHQSRVVAMDFVEVDTEADPKGLTLDAMATVFLAAVAGYAGRG